MAQTMLLQWYYYLLWNEDIAGSRVVGRETKIISVEVVKDAAVLWWLPRNNSHSRRRRLCTNKINGRRGCKKRVKSTECSRVRCNHRLITYWKSIMRLTFKSMRTKRVQYGYNYLQVNSITTTCRYGIIDVLTVSKRSQKTTLAHCCTVYEYTLP